MSNCYDYMHLLTCDNLENDVWRVVILLAIVLLVFGAVSWLVFRIVKQFSKRNHGN